MVTDGYRQRLSMCTKCVLSSENDGLRIMICVIFASLHIIVWDTTLNYGLWNKTVLDNASQRLKMSINPIWMDSLSQKLYEIRYSSVLITRNGLAMKASNIIGSVLTRIFWFSWAKFGHARLKCLRNFSCLHLRLVKQDIFNFAYIGIMRRNDHLRISLQWDRLREQMLHLTGKLWIALVVQEPLEFLWYPDVINSRLTRLSQINHSRFFIQPSSLAFCTIVHSLCY